MTSMVKWDQWAIRQRSNSLKVKYNSKNAPTVRDAWVVWADSRVSRQHRRRIGYDTKKVLREFKDWNDWCGILARQPYMRTGKTYVAEWITSRVGQDWAKWICDRIISLRSRSREHKNVVQA